MTIYNNKKYVCLLDLAMDFVRGKWKAVILCNLYNNPKRFLELKRSTSGISHKVLIENLKELETDGLIIKNVFNETPPKVEYSLTQKGKDLTSILKGLESWSCKYLIN